MSEQEFDAKLEALRDRLDASGYPLNLATPWVVAVGYRRGLVVGSDGMGRVLVRWAGGAEAFPYYPEDMSGWGGEDA